MRVIAAPSPNCDARGAAVDMLILHYTGMVSGPAALARLRDQAAQVSAHYLVEEDGRVFALVDEGMRAWHAGVSHWRGGTGLNARSIGIEVVNPGHEHGYRPFPMMQMVAVAELCLNILGRHAIPARHVLAHSDVAPDRKQDPGEYFDWQGLAGQGVGLWPAEAAAPAGVEAVPGLLAAIGYRADLPLPVLLSAFQRHWRPARVDGLADEETRGLLRAVAALSRG
jgi:N-acetylmuramoyl-L-alanine amidase